MARGNSGRIVVEIGVELKDSLYAKLSEDGLTLKDWFLIRAQDYLRSSKKPVQLSMLDLLSKNDR